MLKSGIDWGFETFAEYLAMLRSRGCVVNTAAYIGHSSVRTWVMGADASKREATAHEIKEMQTIVRDAMAAGAVGFASSTSPSHNGEGGLPTPSRLASDSEMMGLIKAMGEAGKGVYTVTKGGQMPVPFQEDMARQSGRPVMIAALLHNSSNPETVCKDLDNIASANSRGHRLIGQVSCCPLTMDFTLASPCPVEGLLSWKPALGLQGDALKGVLKDAAFRQSVRAGIAAPTTFRLFNGEWDKVHVVECALASNVALEQPTVADIAKTQGCVTHWT